MDGNTSVAMLAMLFATLGLFALPRRVANERHRSAEEDRLRHMAHHDALTGLHNRHVLEERADDALARAARASAQVAFLAIDLDHFKPVNDDHGHHVGDHILCRIAQALTQTVRAGDTVARIGGDEFFILQEGGDQPFAAMMLAERIGEAIRKLASDDPQMRRISASIGVSMYPEDGTDSTTLRRQADAALYRAKALGRDRFAIYAEATVPMVAKQAMIAINDAASA